MESREARLKRLGVLIKRARKARGMTKVDDLAHASDIGRTTLVAIETGRKSVTSAMYNSLELELGLPIGTMDRVLAGELSAFPGDSEAPAADEQAADELSIEELREKVAAAAETYRQLVEELAKLEAERGRASASRSNPAAG